MFWKQASRTTSPSSRVRRTASTATNARISGTRRTSLPSRRGSARSSSATRKACPPTATRAARRTNTPASTTSWVSFSNVPASANKRFSSFPSDFTKLPLVAFVTPDLCGDMHDCPVDTGDKWLKNNLDAYAQWAKTHSSLLIALP